MKLLILVGDESIIDAIAKVQTYYNNTKILRSILHITKLVYTPYISSKIWYFSQTTLPKNETLHVCIKPFISDDMSHSMNINGSLSGLPLSANTLYPNTLRKCSRFFYTDMNNLRVFSAFWQREKFGKISCGSYHILRNIPLRILGYSMFCVLATEYSKFVFIRNVFHSKRYGKVRSILSTDDNFFKSNNRICRKKFKHIVWS